MRDIDVWYSRFDVESYVEPSGAGTKRTKGFRRNWRRPGTRTACGRCPELSHQVDGERRIVSDPPLIVPIEELSAAASSKPGVRELMASYRRSLAPDRRELASRYRYTHAAHKVVGVGSVGARAWIVLLLGRDSNDPLFLQAKEAQRSVLEPYAGKSAFAHQGRRVVEGQRLMQAASDIFLGWMRGEGLDGRAARLLRAPALGRQGIVGGRSDGAGSAGAVRGGVWLDARPGPCPLGRPRGDRGLPRRGHGIRRAVADFAETYADQNERDYESLMEEVRAGRLEVREDI